MTNQDNLKCYYVYYEDLRSDCNSELIKIDGMHKIN